MHGLVIKNTGSWYTVRTDEGLDVDCKIKGNFRLKGIRSTNPVAVGDIVDIVRNQEGTAFISAIHDRQQCLFILQHSRPQQLYHTQVAEPQQAEPHHRCQRRPSIPHRYGEPSTDEYHLHRPFPRYSGGIQRADSAGVQQDRYPLRRGASLSRDDDAPVRDGGLQVCSRVCHYRTGHGCHSGDAEG